MKNGVFCFLLSVSSLLAQELVTNSKVTYNNDYDFYMYEEPGQYASYNRGYLIDNNVNFYSTNTLKERTLEQTFAKPTFSSDYRSAFFTRKWFDDDDGWEMIYNYYDNNATGEKDRFSVVDDNGTVLLTDTGFFFLKMQHIYTLVGTIRNPPPTLAQMSRRSGDSGQTYQTLQGLLCRKQPYKLLIPGLCPTTISLQYTIPLSSHLC